MIKFKCPCCSETRLECVMNGIHTCEVTGIKECQDFNYGEYLSNADVEKWQCLECGYVLMDENDRYVIITNSEVIEWCKIHSSDEYYRK